MGAATKPSAGRAKFLRYGIAMVPALGLLASLLLWQLAAQRDAETTEARFHEAAQHMTRLVQERMLRALDLVASFHGLLAVSEPVSRVQFRHQAETLGLPDRFPGLVAMQFSPLVADPERAAFEARVRADVSLDPGGYPDFAIHPPAARPYYLPLLYLEPMAGNEAAFGYDPNAEPGQQRAIERARDSGETIGLPSRQLAEGINGFFIRQALYRRDAPLWTEAQRRAAFRGVIGALFRITDVMKPLLAVAPNGYRLRIEDRGTWPDAEEPPRLLFDTHPPGAISPPARPDAERLVTILPVAGRAWAVAVARPPASHAFSPVPLALLLGGCSATLMLWWLLIAVQRQHESAVRVTARLAHAAQHDALTGLPNRLLLDQRLEEALAGAAGRSGGLALLFIDLDRFKPVNDRLGHAAGDQVLRQLARRLRKELRPCDTVARVGGDEFVVLLPDLPDPEAWQAVADRILAALSRPVLLHGQSVVVGASLGVALHPQHGTTAAALLRHADAAMYAVKRTTAAAPLGAGAG